MTILDPRTGLSVTIGVRPRFADRQGRRERSNRI